MYSVRVLTTLAPRPKGWARERGARGRREDGSPRGRSLGRVRRGYEYADESPTTAWK